MMRKSFMKGTLALALSTALVISGGGFLNSVSAATTDIAIDATNFPDDEFRLYIYQIMWIQMATESYL
jgi:hypothetical protein